MKPTLYIFSLFLFASTLSAQVADTSYTDCDGSTESIYGIIGQGTPLIIASKGLDCSICMSQAPGIQTFAADHPEIRIWGAMNNKYSSALPTCTGSNNWESQYSWNNVFMFLDEYDRWVGAGFPWYYVISPVDSTVVYEGSFSQATIEALALAPSAIGEPKAKTFSLFYDAAARRVQFVNPSMENSNFTLVNATGQTILETPVTGTQNQTIQIALPENLPHGVYLALLRDGKGNVFSGKLLLN